MNLGLPNFITNLWERSSRGTNMYIIDQETGWGSSGVNLDIAQNHPILTPGLLFVSKIFSQASFKVRKISNGKIEDNHWMLDLIRDPNFYQTQQDFLEALMFSMIAEGVAIVYKKKNIMFDDDKSTKAIYLLNKSLIQWPSEFVTSMSNDPKTKVGNIKIKYDASGENLDIKIKDLMFFYDLPNGLQKNKFKARSRLDGLEQTLINTNDSLLAKNIILKTNGKELITGVKDGGHLSPDEKKEMDDLFNNTLGLGSGRKRSFLTKAELTWKSLHIALRDLGLDESVKVDGNIIYTALHIPKDILSLEAKKTTYNNFKESMVSYIQNEMQSSLNAFTAVFNKMIEPGYELVGTYEHLPIMQYILIERYKVAEGLGAAILSMRNAGLPDDYILKTLNIDSSIKLKELKDKTNENQEQQPENQ